MVTHRGKCREPAIALVTPECQWPECQEDIPWWNEAFLSLIQAPPNLMCQGWDTEEQGQGFCAWWITAECISTRPKATSAPLKCQDFLMGLVMGCTGQLPNHHRTSPRQSRVKNHWTAASGYGHQAKKKEFQTSTSKILRKTAPKHVCSYTQKWLLGESKPRNCLWITEPWRKALCAHGTPEGRQRNYLGSYSGNKVLPPVLGRTAAYTSASTSAGLTPSSPRVFPTAHSMFFHPKGAELCSAVCGSYKGRTHTFQVAENSQTACWPHCPCCSWVFSINTGSESSGLGCAVVGVIQALLPKEDLKRALEKLQDSEMELTMPPSPFWFTIPSNFAQESGL